MEDLKELEAIERLSAKLKKVQAKKFVKKMATLQDQAEEKASGATATSRQLKILALVIGVKDYTGVTPLANTLNDADDIAAKFEEMGCDVRKRNDATQA